MKNGIVPFGPREQPPLWFCPRPRFLQRQPLGLPLPKTIDRDHFRIFLQLMPSPPTTQVQPLAIVTDPQAFASACEGISANIPAAKEMLTAKAVANVLKCCLLTLI